MTERKDKLIELLAKVEAGAAMHGDFRCLEVPMQDARYTEIPVAARLAYKGSLDAAKALHEAVLPDLRFSITRTGASVYGHDGCDMKEGRSAGNPARAWLIAILKALISEAAL